MLLFPDDEDEGREDEAEEDPEEAAQDLQEGFLGEASVPLSAAQVELPPPCHASNYFVNINRFRCHVRSLCLVYQR